MPADPPIVIYPPGEDGGRRVRAGARFLVHRRPDDAERFPGGVNWMLLWTVRILARDLLHPLGAGPP
ncbi:hypothetical protein ACIQCD_17640 [Streptomyces sp. NPDC093250]|uniref:hypothetical protein n=1 Tax=unclassified Streptomyces TaxID=2593676 RepID=UPI003435D346